MQLRPVGRDACSFPVWNTTRMEWQTTRGRAFLGSSVRALAHSRGQCPCAEYVHRCTLSVHFTNIDFGFGILFYDERTNVGHLEERNWCLLGCRHSCRAAVCSPTGMRWSSRFSFFRRGCCSMIFGDFLGQTSPHDLGGRAGLIETHSFSGGVISGKPVLQP